MSSEKSNQKSKTSVKDKYGFKKLIISTTAIGKVFAQDTETGNIEWSRFYPDVFGNTAAAPLKLTIHTTAFDPESEAEITIVAYSGGKDRQATHVATLNAITGQTINKESFGMGALSALAIDTSASSKAIVLVAEDLSLRIYPTSAAQTVEKQLLKKQLFFHVINRSTGKVAGYALASKQQQAKQIWSHSFSSEIVSVAEHSSPMNEHISSLVHLTGNGDVLHKYLNPHLFAVATVASTRVEEAGQIHETKNVEIYLIESISGDVIYRASHPFSDGPVSLALDENFLVYHYLNEKQKRFELSIVEMFTNDTSIEQSLVSAMLKYVENCIVVMH